MEILQLIAALFIAIPLGKGLTAYELEGKTTKFAIMFILSMFSLVILILGEPIIDAKKAQKEEPKEEHKYEKVTETFYRKIK